MIIMLVMNLSGKMAHISIVQMKRAVKQVRMVIVFIYAIIITVGGMISRITHVKPCAKKFGCIKEGIIFAIKVFFVICILYMYNHSQMCD